MAWAAMSSQGPAGAHEPNQKVGQGVEELDTVEVGGE